ncbi:hypothetical protein ACT4ZY_04440 [Acinetobacter baumannii]|uniref:hypothetical protein n=1 Tax=Acinetobacter baumannii TaxID=470 RepID=UPI000BF41453|nr:hypothetical protein [Acinetobacter baumannii]MDC4688077.1 hypothetical protein [Acinetobacter baumannii]MDC4985793.1 hypothetical protein [Acinetobacter baumannii]MDC5291648.1 hypothetical protein [Acinetobacter baumannii]MDC5504219.1 hypothetical protein [Acinetobacter baumannii]CAA0251910.1 hypothetical protein ABKPCSM17A_02793 [Acinetobacter baumannii]
MSEDNQAIRDLHKLNADTLEKTTIMLLTATTASIGYILTQIKDEHWSSLIYFPMAALALLSASFICGLLYLYNQAERYDLNRRYIETLQNPTKSYSLAGQLREQVKINERQRSGQYVCFLLGALCYALYVFFKIYVKSHM